MPPVCPTSEEVSFRVIAHIESDFAEKFGIPRQSGIVEELTARIVFEPTYRNPDALRGITDFSHLWLLWEFSEARREQWSPTVRPPRLGGNTRMGVFATRSPFRPSPIGLSCVRLLGLEHDPHRGSVLLVGGADLLNGTPILDIKPYLPYTDCRPEATDGFAGPLQQYRLTVNLPAALAARLPEDKRAALVALLENDPRPSYQDDPRRVYGFSFAGFEIRFTVEGGHLTVTDILRI